MLPTARSLYSDSILADAAGRYGVVQDQLIELDGNENFVYFAAGRNLVLRVGHSLHRSPAEVDAEVAWVAYLADRGAPVSAPVPSLRGRKVEVIEAEGGATSFVVTGWERASGAVLDDAPTLKRAAWNDALFAEWGRVTGLIHRLYREWPRSRPLPARRHWHEMEPIKRFTDFVPESEAVIRASALRHLADMRRLPSDPASYGMVHGDLTQWNFAVDAGRLTLFDFDHAQYCWFVRDLAEAAYYARASDTAGEDPAFSEHFIRTFVKGYRTEHHLAASWIAELPRFFMFITIGLYGTVHQTGDPANLTDEARVFLERARRRLEQDEPVVDLDFARLAATL